MVGSGPYPSGRCGIFCRQRAEAAGDFQAVALQQILPHFGVVHTLRHTRRVQRPQPMAFRNMHGKPHRLNARYERQVVAPVPLPTVFAALFGHHRQPFARA